MGKSIGGGIFPSGQRFKLLSCLLSLPPCVTLTHATTDYACQMTGLLACNSLVAGNPVWATSVLFHINTFLFCMTGGGGVYRHWRAHDWLHSFASSDTYVIFMSNAVNDFL